VMRNLESVMRLAEQLRAERLIDYLSSAHWLPSYAFRQDVVKLLVMQANLTERMRLERDAEYGIAEYAPGSEVVADGLLLTSRALNLQNRELKIEAYRVCARCNRVEFAPQQKDLADPCPSCGNRPTGPHANPRNSVVPRGFTTLIDEPAREVRLDRLKPPPNSEVYFIKGASKFLAHPVITRCFLGIQPGGGTFPGELWPQVPAVQDLSLLRPRHRRQAWPAHEALGSEVRWAADRHCGSGASL
jgi:hypothetical protein